MSKSKIKEILIAVVIGATINLLSKITELLLEIQTSELQQLTASVGGGVIYLARNFKS